MPTIMFCIILLLDSKTVELKARNMLGDTRESSQELQGFGDLLKLVYIKQRRGLGAIMQPAVSHEQLGPVGVYGNGICL